MDTFSKTFDPRQINWHEVDWKSLTDAVYSRYDRLKASGEKVSVLIVDQNTGERKSVRRALNA